jgi:hypothetical protein
MQKLDSEFELSFHPASFIGPVDSNRIAALLLDHKVIDSISTSVTKSKKTTPRTEVEKSEPPPRLHTPGEMASLLAPDLQGLHRWD